MERSRLTLDVHPGDLPPSYDSAMRTSSLPPITASAPEPASAPYPVTPTLNPPYPVTPVLNRPPYPVTPDSGQPPYPIPRMHDPLGSGSQSSAQHSIRVPFPMPISIPIPMPQPIPVRMPMPESPSRNPNPLPPRHSEVGTPIVRQASLHQVPTREWTLLNDQRSMENRMVAESRNRETKIHRIALILIIGILILVMIFFLIIKILHHYRNF